MRMDQVILLMANRIAEGLIRRLRIFCYARVLKSMGLGCQICKHVMIKNAQSVSLGNEVYLNECVILQSCDGSSITVGSRVCFSYGVYVLTGGLDIAQGAGHHIHVSAPVVIEDEVWIGARAIVLPGVTIGRGAVVAAGAVVKHDVPPNAVVAGVPAKVVRFITRLGTGNGQDEGQGKHP